MISDADAIEIEHPCSSHDTAVTSSFNVNKIPPTEDQKISFFKKIISHKPCCLSLLPPYFDLYVPNAEGISLFISPLTNLYAPQNEELTYMELLHLCEDFEFNLSNDQLGAIAQRAGRITASKMKAACHNDPAFPSIGLIKQILLCDCCDYGVFVLTVRRILILMMLIALKMAL